MFLQYDDYTSDDIMVLDENSEYLGVPRDKLMENAGAAVARAARKHVSDGYVVIIAGLGNNGGDGFVAARHLSRYVKVKVILLGSKERIRTREARANYLALWHLNDTVELMENPSLDELRSVIASSSLIIDAMLGTGVKGELREPIRSIVGIINRSEKPIIAIDTPTGLNPSTGDVHGIAVRADLTVTFHGMKKGFKGNTGYTGDIIVEDIGIPLEAELHIGPGDWSAVSRNLSKETSIIRICSDLDVNEDSIIPEILSFVKDNEIFLDFSHPNLTDEADIIYVSATSAESLLSREQGLDGKILAIRADGPEDVEKLHRKVDNALYIWRNQSHALSSDVEKLLPSLYELMSKPPVDKIIIDDVDNAYALIQGRIKVLDVSNIDIDGWILSSLIARLLTNEDLYSLTGCLWRMKLR